MNRFVLDAMCCNPVMIGPERDARSTAGDARRNGVRHVIVTDGSGVLGVVSTDDLERAAPGTSVAALIEETAIGVEEQATLEQAEAIMDRHQVDCLPVMTWEGLLAGVITRGDIRRARACCHSEPPDAVPPSCAACGALHDVVVEPDIDVAFCRDCLGRAHMPSNPEDMLYITLGGGD